MVLLTFQCVDCDIQFVRPMLVLYQLHFVVSVRGIVKM
jgi:hypothetical protein